VQSQGRHEQPKGNHHERKGRNQETGDDRHLPEVRHQDVQDSWQGLEERCFLKNRFYPGPQLMRSWLFIIVMRAGSPYHSIGRHVG